MTDKTEVTTETDKTPPAADAAGKTPPPKVEATPAKPDAKTPPAPDAAVAAGATTEKKRSTLKETDDEIPDDVEILELSPAALKKRLGRATKKELKARFGTDDMDDIDGKLKRLASLEAQEEERERSKMSEVDKANADKTKAEERATKAEQRLQALYDERIIQTEESRVIKIAEEAGMDPEYIEDQFPKLAKYLNDNFKPKELKKLKDGEIKKWFVERMKVKPKLAKETTQQQQEPPAKEKPKVPLTNGGGGGRGPNADETATAATEKTFKPGQKNSMTRGEARAEMAKLGVRY